MVTLILKWYIALKAGFNRSTVTGSNGDIWPCEGPGFTIISGVLPALLKGDCLWENQSYRPFTSIEKWWF